MKKNIKTILMITVSIVTIIANLDEAISNISEFLGAILKVIRPYLTTMVIGLFTYLHLRNRK